MGEWQDNIKDIKLKDLCTVTSSKRIYMADYVENGIPFVRSKEIVQRFSGYGQLKSELFISRSKFESLKDRFGAPSAGDILLTSVGTLGVPYLVTDKDEFYFKDGNLIWFRNFNGMNSKFFYYWIQSHEGCTRLAKCTIGTSQPAYTIERLKEIEAPKFSIYDQDNIALILSNYDDLIENNRRRMALLEEAARLLYREWFVHLRFPGHEHTRIVDGVPDGWEQKKLGEQVVLNYGKSLKSDLRVDGPYPVYGSSGIVGTHDKALSNGPGIIVGRKGNVGSVYWSSKDFFAIDTVYFIDSETSNLFLYYAMKQMQFLSTDAAVPGLNRDFAYSQPLLIPTKPLLHRFFEIVGPIHRQMEKLEQFNQKLCAARDLLLPRLMNGEIPI